MNNIEFVWPFSPPPVYTGNWDTADWDKYIRSFRPKDYHGAEDDKEAWLDYIDNKNLESFRKQWPNHIVTLVGRDKFNIKKRD